MKPAWPWTVTLWCGLVCLFCSGCGKASEGPTRYRLTGAALFDGQPIPYGSILLEPDRSRGNQGPAGMADIRQGEYQMREGRGHVGGAHVITILATNGKRPTNPDEDTTLFLPYKIHLDLPAEDSRHDFDVPRSAVDTAITVPSTAPSR
jgi:hypothetical protein